MEFNETIFRFDTSKIEVYRDEMKLKTEDAIEMIYLSNINKLTVVLKKDASTHDRYQVKLKANAVFNVADNGNTKLLTTETTTLNFMIKGMVVNSLNKILTPWTFQKTLRIEV